MHAEASEAHFIFPALLLLFVCSTAQAQWPDDPLIDQRVQQGIDNLYNFEFE